VLHFQQCKNYSEKRFDGTPASSLALTKRLLFVGTPSMRIQKIGIYERFIVVDDFEHVWTGPLGWMPDRRDALVFADRKQAEKVIRILSKQAKEIEDGHKYIAEVVVTTASWLPLEELRETLDRHVNIFNQIEHDLLILGVEIDWDSLREDSE
jgi:hypothetical protein